MTPRDLLRRADAEIEKTERVLEKAAERLGDASVVARKLGVTPEIVRAWVRRD